MKGQMQTRNYGTRTYAIQQFIINDTGEIENFLIVDLLLYNIRQQSLLVPWYYNVSIQ